MKNDNRPTVQNIKIDAQQVIVGDKNTVKSITGNNNSDSSFTNDNSAMYRQENITHNVKIDSNASNETPQKSNRNKIAAIIGAIATFCTISGFSGVSIYNCISAGGEGGSDIGESISDTEVNENSGANDLSIASVSSKPDEATGTIDSPNIGESSTADESSIKNDSTKPSTSLEESGLSNESSPEECKIFLYSEYSKITIYGENNMTATLNFEADEVTITAYLASGKVDTLSMNRKNSTEWGKKVIFNETGVHKIIATATAPNGCVIEGATEIEVIPVNLGDYNFDQLFQFT